MWLSRILILTLVITFADRAFLGKLKKSKKSQPVCGKNYMRQVNGKCYYFGIKKINWYGALNNCLRKGLTLADLETIADLEAVARYLTSQNIVEDFWFGGNDLAYDGKFTYISSGKTVAHFSDKVMLAPTNQTSLDKCLEVRLRPDASLVTNENCQERQNFICEKHNEMICEIPGPEDGTAKETHHSHEHLHHFHHDVIKDRAVKDAQHAKEASKNEADNNSKGDEAKSDGNVATVSPSLDAAGNESEIRTSSSETSDGHNQTDTDNTGTTKAANGTDGALALDEGSHTTAAANAAADATTSPADAAAGAEPSSTAAAEGSATAAPAVEGQTAAAASEAPAAEGATPAAEGATPAAEGATPAAEGAAPASQGPTPPP